MRTLSIRALLLSALFLTVGCAGGHAKPADAKSLYLRLGSLKGISAVIHQSLVRIAGDPRVKDYFAGADLQKLEDHFIQLACVGAGGPCKYEGRSMAESHEGLHITNAAFDAVLEDILFTMRKLKVHGVEQDQVLSLLNSMRKDIVAIK